MAITTGLLITISEIIRYNNIKININDNNNTFRLYVSNLKQTK